MVCHMHYTMSEKYSQVKCVGMWFLFFLVVVCFVLVCGLFFFFFLILSLAAFLYCLWAETLIAHDWATLLLRASGVNSFEDFPGSRFVIFNIVSPVSWFSIQMFYPGRLRIFQKVSKVICRSCEILLWKSGMMWRYHMCCAYTCCSAVSDPAELDVHRPYTTCAYISVWEIAIRNVKSPLFLQHTKIKKSWNHSGE